MLRDKLNCTSEADVLKYSVRKGSVGKYISVIKGPKADNSDRVIIRITGDDFSI